MKKRYKVIVNVEVIDPDMPYPAGGDYMHLTRREGVIRQITRTWVDPAIATVTLDKVIDKGEIAEK